MRVRGVLLTLAAVGLVCAGSPAAAAPADRDATAVQWAGTHTGVCDLYDWHLVEPLEVVVSPGGSTGLSVDTTVGDGSAFPDDDARTVTTDGLLPWIAPNPEEWATTYDSTAATCSGGVVASYSGTNRTYHGGPGWYARGKFQLTRSA